MSILSWYQPRREDVLPFISIPVFLDTAFWPTKFFLAQVFSEAAIDPQRQNSPWWRWLCGRRTVLIDRDILEMACTSGPTERIRAWACTMQPWCGPLTWPTSLATLRNRLWLHDAEGATLSDAALDWAQLPSPHSTSVNKAMKTFFIHLRLCLPAGKECSLDEYLSGKPQRLVAPAAAGSSNREFTFPKPPRIAWLYGFNRPPPSGSPARHSPNSSRVYSAQRYRGMLRRKGLVRNPCSSLASLVSSSYPPVAFYLAWRSQKNDEDQGSQGGYSWRRSQGD
ncbi:hypothetical protein NMY22_g12201 [Coprinellus aureogranulatus]|nr:hypothetical protein NMY22_g12201 [Coprinellus aureogranulatus]